MISLSSIETDTNGDIVFDLTGESTLDDSTRRVSRTKTLDGGCVIIDGGFSPADKTFNLSTQYDPDVHSVVKHLHEDMMLIHVSVNGAFYTGVISDLDIKRTTVETIQIRILIKEKLA
jgi:hypothetical protein